MREPREKLREAFHESGRRLTAQRRLILDVLKGSEEHLEADAVHDRAKGHVPGLSLATVYRTLGLLKEMGLVEEHRLGEGHSHYEAVREEPHYHFTCQRCGKVIEFDTPLVDKIGRHLCERKGIEVVKAHLHLMGCCRDCLKRPGRTTQ
ncbi:MAG: Fur family transcriptional regulator [Anaerolineae bacterium]|jgi:Fe2+ or Zn2+ uptake regulation protein